MPCIGCVREQGRLKDRRIVADTVAVSDTAAGVQLLADRKADALFADRSLLLDAVSRSGASADLVVLERLYRRDPIAFSRLYRSRDVLAIYARHYGDPTPGAVTFFQTVALPD
jgi:polar amino acid transport system substrate-binding protein